MMGAEGEVFAHVRPLSDPDSTNLLLAPFLKTLSATARYKGHQHGANADTDNNQPKGVEPLRQASSQTNSEVIMPPTIVPAR